MKEDSKRGYFSVMLSESCKDAFEVLATGTIIIIFLGNIGCVSSILKIAYLLIHTTFSALSIALTARYTFYVIKRQIIRLVLCTLVVLELASCVVVFITVLS